MKKIIVSVVAAGALALAATAMAATVAVTDPSGDFTGQYQNGTDEEGNATYGTQEGYVGVYADGANSGVVACNGNPAHTRPDDGSELVGYVWVGPGVGASNPAHPPAPANAAGAGNNHEDADGNVTGDSPCPEASPSGSVN